jgi:ATP-dependent protease ClpP protease subunit
MADIFVYGVIGFGNFFDDAITGSSINAELGKLEVDEPVRVRINSPGGDFGEAVAIRTALSERQGPVSFQVDSRALSAATMIAPIGTEVRLADSAMMMIHDPWVDPGPSNEEELLKHAQVAAKHGEVLAAYYAERTGKSESDIREMMRAETWMKADEAIDMGIADGMAEGVTDVAAAAIPERFHFRNVPKDYIQTQEKQVLHNKLSQQLAALTRD